VLIFGISDELSICALIPANAEPETVSQQADLLKQLDFKITIDK